MEDLRELEDALRIEGDHKHTSAEIGEAFRRALLGRIADARVLMIEALDADTQGEVEVLRYAAESKLANATSMLREHDATNAAQPFPSVPHRTHATRTGQTPAAAQHPTHTTSTGQSPAGVPHRTHATRTGQTPAAAQRPSHTMSTGQSPAGVPHRSHAAPPAAAPRFPHALHDPHEAEESPDFRSLPRYAREFPSLSGAHRGVGVTGTATVTPPTPGFTPSAPRSKQTATGLPKAVPHDRMPTFRCGQTSDMPDVTRFLATVTRLLGGTCIPAQNYTRVVLTYVGEDVANHLLSAFQEGAVDEHNWQEAQQFIFQHYGSRSLLADRASAYRDARQGPMETLSHFVARYRVLAAHALPPGALVATDETEQAVRQAAFVSAVSSPDLRERIDLALALRRTWHSTHAPLSLEGLFDLALACATTYDPAAPPERDTAGSPTDSPALSPASSPGLAPDLGDAVPAPLIPLASPLRGGGGG